MAGRFSTGGGARRPRLAFIIVKCAPGCRTPVATFTAASSRAARQRRAPAARQVLGGGDVPAKTDRIHRLSRTYSKCRSSRRVSGRKFHPAGKEGSRAHARCASLIAETSWPGTSARDFAAGHRRSLRPAKRLCPLPRIPPARSAAASSLSRAAPSTCRAICAGSRCGLRRVFFRQPAASAASRPSSVSGHRHQPGIRALRLFGRCAQNTASAAVPLALDVSTNLQPGPNSPTGEGTSPVTAAVWVRGRTTAELPGASARREVAHRTAGLTLKCRRTSRGAHQAGLRADLGRRKCPRQNPGSRFSTRTLGLFKSADGELE